MDDSLPQKSHGQLMAEFRAVEAEAYVAARNTSKRSMFLTQYTPDQLREMSAKIYMTDDNVGFALLPDGDMIGVFNNSSRRGAGAEAVILAIAEGAKTTDCYDGYLSRLYNKFGFTQKGSVKFDAEQAPEGWDYATDGNPDIILFEYPDGLSRNPDDVRARAEFAGIEQAARGELIDWRDIERYG